MLTTKQEELAGAFLDTLEGKNRRIYQELMACLLELGYYPQKEKTKLSFKHKQHRKQIAKMGQGGNAENSPTFALRFSGCHGYSRRFQDIAGEAVTRNPARRPLCVSGGCGFCKGEPLSHVYAHTLPSGETRYHCGAYALEIPEIAETDLEELKSLIREEHAYLLEQEAGQPCV